MTFGSIASFGDQSKWLGDPTQYDWVTNNQVLEYNGNVLLPMQNQSYGTVITSTRAVWYGTVSATLQTSFGQGVVSAFILMSGSKDEIDYEFVGSHTNQAQTNYYFQGVLNYTNEASVALSATNETFHTYEFDWNPDTITWKIDGQTARVLNRADTYNATTGEYMFPQTPSVIQLSLWPGGSSVNPEGTIEWAGGPINWDMPEFADPGYLYVTLKDLSITCGDVPSGTTVSGSKAYRFTNSTLLSSDVEITDDNTTLASFEAVGFDPEKGQAINVSGGQALPSNIGAQNVGNATVQVISGDSGATAISGTGKNTAQTLNGFATTSTTAESLPALTTTTSANPTAFAQGGSSETTTTSASKGAADVLTPAMAPALGGLAGILAFLLM
jgi:beta-glucanase (GH16 family)